jgi:hypothetical protein
MKGRDQQLLSNREVRRTRQVQRTVHRSTIRGIRDIRLGIGGYGNPPHVASIVVGATQGASHPSGARHRPNVGLRDTREHRHSFIRFPFVGRLPLRAPPPYSLLLTPYSLPFTYSSKNATDRSIAAPKFAEML